MWLVAVIDLSGSYVRYFDNYLEAKRFFDAWLAEDYQVYLTEVKEMKQKSSPSFLKSSFKISM